MFYIFNTKTPKVEPHIYHRYIKGVFLIFNVKIHYKIFCYYLQLISIAHITPKSKGITTSSRKLFTRAKQLLEANTFLFVVELL